MNEPQLAPPGAGLPLPELFIARVLFRLRVWTTSRQAVVERFNREREIVQGLVDLCPEEYRAKRVLIQRPRGLEDSSRHWSVLMTLDHLRIVNGSIARIIEALAKGVVPPGKASTANVKPNPGAGTEVIAFYEKSCTDLQATVASFDGLKTSVKYPHPWFGFLNAAEWHALSADHMAIHRVQLQRIVAGILAAKNQ